MSARSTGAGRPGSLDEARELVALVSSLSEAGDALNAAAVAERLGVSEERGEKLVGLVLCSTLVGGTGLPLVSDEGGLTLVGADGVRGRRLRLTHAETLALVAALERLGVPGDDPLRATLEESLSSEPVNEDLVRRLMAGRSGTGPLAAVLSCCARAIASRRELLFSYRKSGEKDAERRRVVASALRTEDDAWFLDAFDLARDGERTFRLDRMEDASVGGHPEAPQPETRGPSARLVDVSFDDASYLDLLPWHDLQVVSSPAGKPVRARIPYYGGMWLPRMIAACAGSAHCDDPEVAALVKSYAREQL